MSWGALKAAEAMGRTSVWSGMEKVGAAPIGWLTIRPRKRGIHWTKARSPGAVRSNMNDTCSFVIFELSDIHQTTRLYRSVSKRSAAVKNTGASYN